MTLDQKIEAAEHLVVRGMRHYKKPVLMCSFGKDSMVLLHLIQRRLGLGLPVLFHREPFFPRKYAFANQVIHDWDLTVYDYPVSRTSLCKSNDKFEVLNEYRIGAQTIMLPTGIEEPKNGRFLCGRDDLFLKPIGDFEYPWDVCFIGHKSSDVDPLHGPLPLKADVKVNAKSADAIFPLREFTDEDVWAYTEKFDVPIHHSRYEKVDGTWREKEDKTFNPDYFPACMECMDPHAAEVVTCPKLGMEMTNISHKIPFQQPKFDYCTP